MQTGYARCNDDGRKTGGSVVLCMWEVREYNAIVANAAVQFVNGDSDTESIV